MMTFLTTSSTVFGEYTSFSMVSSSRYRTTLVTVSGSSVARVTSQSYKNSYGFSFRLINEYL